MNITVALKSFLISKGWIKQDTSDADIRKLVLEKLSSGEITAKTLAELTQETETPGTQKLQTLIAQQLEQSLAPFKALLEQGGNKTKKEGEEDDPANPTPPVATLTEDRIKELVAASVKESTKGLQIDNEGSDRITPVKLLTEAAQGRDTIMVRVKEAVESYDGNRKAALMPDLTQRGTKQFDAGRPAMYRGAVLDMPSERDKAICGAVFKWQLSTGPYAAHLPRGLRMTEHDKQLVQWALHNCKWTGVINPIYGSEGVGGASPGFSSHLTSLVGNGIDVDDRKLTEFEIKAALLDDATSGGLEIVPIEFDNMLIITPVLFGELFPLVNVVNISRGRRIEGGALGRPTISTTAQEGTAITPFDNTGFVSAFDTTIFDVNGAMEIGENFLSDSPTNVGQLIMQMYGEEFLKWLDTQIAVGDGTTEPKGIFVSSGTTAVASDNGVAGPATVSDYEGLMFGIDKAFRNAKGGRNVFLGNDTSYRRARSIPVGPADERRVFGMTHRDYMLLDTPYKVNSDISNNQLAYANMGYYRMYRRLGTQIRVENTGNYLALRNMRLIVVRSRWGGQLELGGAAAIMSNAEA